MYRTHLVLTVNTNHMMKSGSPPDKFIVMYHMFTYRIPLELILRVITLWFLVLSHIFRDSRPMGPLKNIGSLAQKKGVL